MDIEEYLAGLGEIPDKACGTKQQVKQKPDKYVVDDGNFWHCWPEEAIKAQVIAARAYALSYNGTLFTDTRSQVYKGGQEKKWAVEETAHKVPRYNGQIIHAYYSADNSQGHGTANHETIWSDLSGNVSALPYLRSVDDSSFAFPSVWTKWQWSTDLFSYNQINDVLQYESQVLPTKSKDFLTALLKDTGEIVLMDFIRDPSERVWKINLIGKKGKRVIAGWFFKELWNDAYAAGFAPGLLYSLTFTLNQQ